MDFLSRTLCCCFRQKKLNNQHEQPINYISNTKGNLNPAFRESPLGSRYAGQERSVDVYEDDHNLTVTSLKNAIMRLSTVSQNDNEIVDKNVVLSLMMSILHYYVLAIFKLRIN
jgi:hypothetical protein